MADDRLTRYGSRRLLLAILLGVGLIWLSGCTGFGQATSEEGLLADATYDWDTAANVTIDLGEDSYTAVIDIEERSSIRIYQTTRYGTEDPIPIRAVQFRYPNGTVVNATEVGVSESRSAVSLDLPADEGTLAYTAPKRSKHFSTPVFVEGSWEVVVPAGHRVDNMILATVRPGGYDTQVVDDRVHITWEHVSSRTVRVEYYLARDAYLFGGLVIVAAVAGLAGVGYVYRQILALRAKRQEMGLDIDIDDDSGRNPPPGMR